jgi:hypothetical protein
MKLMKKTVHSMPAFVQAIVDLTKEGKVVDKSTTRGSFGLSYTIGYYSDEVVVAKPATVVVEDATTEPVETSDEVSPVTFEQDLSALSLQELRDILTAKGIKFAPAAKEAKLIELIKAAG